MPKDEKYDLIRICFQMEQAFWYYVDNLLKKEQLPELRLKMFTFIMFNYIDRLRKYIKYFDNIIKQWVKYKLSIPTHGVILLDSTMNYVLLVQSYGSKIWGFPKGKQNYGENSIDCACREVFEEIGYDCRNKLSNNCYLETKCGISTCRLYILTDIPMDYKFKSHVSYEILNIKWFNINDIKTFKYSNHLNSHKFYLTLPFIKNLQKWILNEKINRNHLKDFSEDTLSFKEHRSNYENNSDKYMLNIRVNLDHNFKYTKQTIDSIIWRLLINKDSKNNSKDARNELKQECSSEKESILHDKTYFYKGITIKDAENLSEKLLNFCKIL